MAALHCSLCGRISPVQSWRWTSVLHPPSPGARRDASLPGRTYTVTVLLDMNDVHGGLHELCAAWCGLTGDALFIQATVARIFRAGSAGITKHLNVNFMWTFVRSLACPVGR